MNPTALYLEALLTSLTQGPQWIQDRAFSYGRKGVVGACLLGHLGLAMNHGHDSQVEVTGYAEALLVKVIREQFPERALTPRHLTRILIRFNDHPETRRDDVILVVEKALRIAEEQV